MPKKQVTPIKETAAAPASPAKSQPVKPKTPRITAAKHSKAVAIAESPVLQPELTHEAIATVAYGYWESRGYQGGDALDDWFRAEAELKRVTIH
jgi:hypothetical protein